MKYFFDTEFIEYGPTPVNKGTIDLISIGIISEDGREYYAVTSEFDGSKADDWVKENVLAKLQGETFKPRAQISAEIMDFILQSSEKPEFWAYYADYDWVAFCWLWGRMIDLPKIFPMYCMDLKQAMDMYRIERWQLPPDPEDEHHALADAKWLRKAYEKCKEIVMEQPTGVINW